MSTGKDIVVVADYHAQNIAYRQFNEATGQERTGSYPTCREEILRQVRNGPEITSRNGV